MGADQIAEIRPALQELAEAATSREPRWADLCVTFTVSHMPVAWAQALTGTLNFAYPRADHPLFLARACGAPMPSGLAVATFVPEGYVTFQHGATTTRALASFIDAFLASVHGLDSDYALDVAFTHTTHV
jgi:hypothetical protein